ncbi:MAG: manganese efflux pump MntP family protein [Oscillospiraceae bacterium]|jgi:putative Mn2+ efflux pump MntP|nr:manganese efflux pump MntP family protein [Oscillospiraceae bacterium]
MELLTVCVMAITLALDALAVAVTNGMACAGFRPRHAVWMGVYFGAFQFFMPLIGYLLGSQLLRYIEGVDHWLAMLLLGFIGGRMMYNALRRRGKEEGPLKALTHPQFLLQALATSVDALAVGLTLPLLKTPILISAAIIGCVAFGFSLLGGLLGRRLGALFGRRAEVIGGLVLVLLGVRIVLEHTL